MNRLDKLLLLTGHESAAGLVIYLCQSGFEARVFPDETGQVLVGAFNLDGEAESHLLLTTPASFYRDLSTACLECLGMPP